MNKQTGTTKMLEMYRERPDVSKSMALTSFFQTKPEYITNADSVNIDIERQDEDIAPVLRDISTGANINSADIYTGKQFKPPAYAEKIPYNVFDLFNVPAGVTEYENADVSFQAQLANNIMGSWEKLQGLIMRSIELQAAQVLQTGTLSLPGKDGITKFTLDYVPKTTHFPTVSTNWSDPTADALGDLDALGDVIRNDGLVDPENVIMGDNSWKGFYKNEEVQKVLDNRRMDVAAFIDPRMQNNGLKFRGEVKIGTYSYRIFTYNARYNLLDGSAKVRYLDPDKVIMMAGIDDFGF